jgi:lipoprotein-anchoring transpeptidase ErfK/SrfK
MASTLLAGACGSDGSGRATGTTAGGGSHSAGSTSQPEHSQPEQSQTGAVLTGTGLAGPQTAAVEPPWVVVAHVIADRVEARAQPSADAAVVASLVNPTEAGGPLVFQAVADPVTDPAGQAVLDQDWLEVHLPVRPNGTTGWVRRDEVELSRNRFRVEVDTSGHQLRVYRDNNLFLETVAAIGTGSTPTPLGRFYIIELLQPPDGPNGPYGPFAFGLSGFSESLTSFAGGDGVVGIHGTNRPDQLGTDVSHGCIRVANDVIESLAGLIPLGTPVVIT